MKTGDHTPTLWDVQIIPHQPPDELLSFAGQVPGRKVLELDRVLGVTFGGMDEPVTHRLLSV